MINRIKNIKQLTRSRRVKLYRPHFPYSRDKTFRLRVENIIIPHLEIPPLPVVEGRGDLKNRGKKGGHVNESRGKEEMEGQ